MAGDEDKGAGAGSSKKPIDLLKNKPVKTAITPKPFKGSKGDDPELWIQKFESIATNNAWDDDCKLYMIASFLEDYAYRWYTQETKMRNTPWTWPEFVKEFKMKSCQLRSMMTDRLKFNQMKQEQNQTSLDFYYKAHYAGTNLNLKDEDIYAHIKVNLLPEPYRAVVMQKANTLQDMLTTLENYEEGEIALKKQRLEEEERQNAIFSMIQRFKAFGTKYNQKHGYEQAITQLEQQAMFNSETNPALTYPYGQQQQQYYDDDSDE